MHRDLRSQMCPGAEKKKEKKDEDMERYTGTDEAETQRRPREKRLGLLCQQPRSVKDGQQPPEGSPSVLQEAPAPPTPGLQTSSLPNKLLSLWSVILC